MSEQQYELVSATHHVLVVEDNPVVRLLLAESLADLGFSSSTFETAAEGLNHLEQIRGACTLIIADQGLPGGIQGTQFLRVAHEKWPTIPSILCSGYSVDENLIPSFASYLHKPYTLDQLEKMIDGILLRHDLKLQS